MQSSDEVAVSPGKAKPKQGKDNYAGKKLSPDGSRRLLLSPVKKLSALRLVSPIDSDQELNDLEVASVLAEGGSDSSLSPTKVKSHETPVRPSTVMTNLQRGNVQTTTPVFHCLTIHQMAAQGELIYLKQEVQEDGNINSIDDYGLTPLLWACANGQLATVEYLVDQKADLDIVGHHGENGLLFASCYGYHDIVKLFLKLGVDVNYTDETDSTALMYAAFNNHPACVKLLLEYGADLTLKNEDDYMVMDLTVGQGHKAVQQVIEMHMLSLFDGLT